MKKICFIGLFFSLVLPFAGNAQKSLLKLEDIWSGIRFASTGMSEVRSMNDGQHYTEMVTAGKLQCVVKNEFRTGKTVDTLFKASSVTIDGKPVTFSDYEFSADESKILLTTQEEAIYRHSTKADYLVYDLKKGTTVPVSAEGKQMYASFSPSGNVIAFVRDNNLFVKDLSSGQEKQVTNDGRKNEIINGATDWVYEEEFSFSQGYQWSPDGNHIAFYRFDESNVKEFNLTYYEDVYPREEKYKYPKAGEENSKVEIFIYSLSSQTSVKADVNKEADQYIPRIKWTRDPSKLCVMRMNRLQNKLELYTCEATTGNSTRFFTEENSRYIEVTDDLFFIPGNKEFIWTSTRDGYNHIYLYDMNGKMVRQVTKGKWDVIKFYGYDEPSGKFYYQAAVKSPMQKGVYASTRNGKQSVVNDEPGTSAAVFGMKYRYYFISHSNIDKPHTVTLYSVTEGKVRVIRDGQKVLDNMSKFDLTKPEFFSFTTSESVSLNGWMIKPPDFDAAKKYPVIQYMYGGPNSQTVKDEWMGPNYFWFQLLAQKGYLVVSVDNRGTGARGEEFNKCTYKQLGHFETIDQIETAKWLTKQPYVDGSRIGAWGWSFGGYMTSLLMTKGAEFFKTAVAVAPVTNWRFYDSIYTERYLQTPQLNPEGYGDNSPINFASLLKGNFLLIHGTDDDNVHMQNSMEFITALVKEKRQFDTFFYPGKAHSISGVRLHLYTMMTNFFLEKL